MREANGFYGGDGNPVLVRLYRQYGISPDSKDSVSEIESSAVQEVPPEESVDLEESPLPDAVVPDPLQKMDIQICVVDQEGNPAPNIETTLSYYLPNKI